MEEEVTRDGRLLLIKLGPLGPVSNNAYIIADSVTNDALVVDAPEESEIVVAATKGLKVKQIVVTHRHRDHWAGIDALLAGIEAPVLCHEADREPYAAYIKDVLADGDELEVGGVIINDVPTFRVDHMPYGGVKESGFGREGVRYAIEELTELRLCVITKSI